MKYSTIFALLCCQSALVAQSDSTASPLTFSGYVETYYGYDFGNPANHNRPGFVYSHNRHNEVNLNLGFVKAAYAQENISFRGEYYHDANGVIIATGTRNGFRNWGYSANLDYAVRDNILWRIEARGLNSKDAIFARDGKATRNNFLLTSSLAISF